MEGNQTNTMQTVGHAMLMLTGLLETPSKRGEKGDERDFWLQLQWHKTCIDIQQLHHCLGHSDSAMHECMDATVVGEGTCGRKGSAVGLSNRQDTGLSNGRRTVFSDSMHAGPIICPGDSGTSWH